MAMAELLSALALPLSIKADTMPLSAKSLPPVLLLKVTAYSSSVDETDDTPLITASGMTVRDGIVATNLLPFGTLVKIPKLFGDKIFIVEDRMSKKMKNNIDIWMSSKAKALRFGVAYAEVNVVSATELSKK